MQRADGDFESRGYPSLPACPLPPSLPTVVTLTCTYLLKAQRAHEKEEQEARGGEATATAAAGGAAANPITGGAHDRHDTRDLYSDGESGEV